MNENPVVMKIVEITERLEGIKHNDLFMKLIAEFEFINKNQILEAISTASQDGYIKRIEYTLPKQSWSSRYFYVPTGSQLVN